MEVVSGKQSCKKKRLYKRSTTNGQSIFMYITITIGLLKMPQHTHLVPAQSWGLEAQVLEEQKE